MSISLALRVTHNAASHVSSPRVEIVRSARRHKRRIQVTVLWQPAECEWWFHPLGWDQSTVAQRAETTVA